MKKRFWFLGLVMGLLAIIVGCNTAQNTGGDGDDNYVGQPFLTVGTLGGQVVQPSGHRLSTTTITANYVYAVNTCPTYGSEWRKKASINQDGSFSIELTKGDPWVLAFIDTTQTGPAMVKAIFRADTLDSISPKLQTLSDETDLGTVTISSGNASLATANYDTFIGNLGMDTTEADLLGDNDDLMLRYINPDIDSNGVLDFEEGLDVGITMWVAYRYGDASLISNNVILGLPLPTAANLAFTKTEPQLRIYDPGDLGFAGVPARWSVSWTEPGNLNPVALNDATVKDMDHAVYVGTAGGGGSYSATELALNFNIESDAVTNIPYGTYTYEVLNDQSVTKSFVFTNIQTPADLSDATDYVFPFPVFNNDGQGNIESIDYTWMKYNGTNFEPATASDIEFMLGKNMAEMKWYDGTPQNDEHGHYCSWTPANLDFALTGNVLYSDCTHGASATGRIEDINNVGISFTSKLGMLMKLNVQE